MTLRRDAMRTICWAKKRSTGSRRSRKLLRLLGRKKSDSTKMETIMRLFNGY